MNILQELKALVAKQRVYASFFKSGSKTHEEISVVRNLLESMATRGESRFFDPCVSPVDPPDCLAKAADGRAVAIEVTEIVCEEAVRINAQQDRAAISQLRPGVAVMRRWEQQDFIAHIAGRVEDKDTKKLKGGPYGAYVVVMHTDEPELEREKCEAWLRGHMFGPFRQVCEAYLLFSYMPKVGYQYVRLQIAQQNHAGDGRDARA
jgi:hypothetical protein